MILCSMIDGMIYKRQPVKKGSRRKGDSRFFEKIKESGLKEDLLQQSFFLLQMNNLIAYLIIEGVNGRLKKKNVNITQMLSN